MIETIFVEQRVRVETRDRILRYIVYRTIIINGGNEYIAAVVRVRVNCTELLFIRRSR